LRCKLELGKKYTVEVLESRQKRSRFKGKLISENKHIWTFRKQNGLIESFCKNTYQGELKIQEAR